MLNKSTNKQQRHAILRSSAILLCFILSLQQSFGQACNASAGNVALGQQTYCPNDAISPQLTGSNEDADYTNQYLVVDSNSLIVGILTNGNPIIDLNLGAYTLHNINFENANPPTSPPQIGGSIAGITDLSSDCFDISSAIAFSIADTVAPTAVCAAMTINLYLDTNGDLGLTPSDFNFGSSDADCSDLSALGLSQEIFDCSHLGLQQIDLYIEDEGGNKDTCSTMINVLDTIAPVLSCRDTVIDLSPIGFAELDAGDIILSTQDACDGNPLLSLEQSEFLCEDLGTKMLKAYAQDASGSIGECNFQLTVRDTTGPVVKCQAGVAYLTVEGSVIPDTNSFNDASFDICGGDLTFSLLPVSYTCSAIGNPSLTLVARDQFGNENTCTTTVAIIDTIKPMAICVDTFIYLDIAGNGSIAAATVDASTDNCSIDSIWIDESSFDCTQLGTQTVLLTVMDNSNNQSQCTANVEVLDTIAPEAICQEQTIFLSSQGTVNLSATLVNNNSTDNCGTISALNLNRTQFSCITSGEQTVILTVFDGNNNSDTCHAIVTVLDTIPPMAQCRDIIVYLDASGEASLSTQMVDQGSSDNCGQISALSLSQMSFSCDDLDQATVWLRVTDSANNIDSCSSTITVLDTIAPEASCQASTIYVDGNGLATLNPQDLDQGSFDLCTNIAVFDASKKQFTCGDAGDNQVFLFVEDLYGNIDSCQTTVTVLDTVPPEAICKADTFYLDTKGELDLSVEDINDGSLDNCGALESITLSPSSFTCATLADQSIQLNIEDKAGNKDSCSVTISVLDTIAPQAKCKDFELALGPDGAALLTPDLINNLSEDNCGIQSLMLDSTSFDCAELGPNSVVLTATDASNNLDTCHATVTVVDKDFPRLNARAITLALGLDGTVRINPDTLDDGSTDNCSIDSFWLDQSTFDCSDLGQNVLQLSGRDIDGNVSQEAVLVTIIDDRKPTFNCPQSTTVNSDADGLGACGVVILDQRFNPSNVEDNCGISSVVHDNAAAVFDSTLLGADFPVGAHLVQWLITDTNGQKDSCSFTITVVDNEAPMALCKDTVLVQLGGDGMLVVDSMLVDNGSTDNCGITEYAISETTFDCADVGFNTLTVRVSDASNNEDHCDVVVGIVASSACNEPAFSNENGPDIADPCSCRGNRTFNEQVVIGPTTKNQIWTVKSTSLLNPATLLPFTVGTAFVEVPINADSSIYTLQGVHLDGLGYTVVAESAFFADLTISNICFYPQPVIMGLDGPICLYTDPIGLQAEVANGVIGTGSFTVNGQPADTIDPMALGVGTHRIEYTFNAGDPASLNNPSNVGCTESVVKEIEVTETNPFFACVDLVSVTSNASCEIEIIPEMILSGEYFCYDDYQVFLSLNNQGVPNPVPSIFAGQTLRAIVQHKPSGRICSGNIRLRDVRGPEIVECPGDIQNRFICTDVDSILNNPATLDSTNRLYTGRPIVVDNCTGTNLRFRDALIANGGCAAGSVTIIRRTFTANDEFGNESVCEQLIYFERPEISEIFFPDDINLNLDCEADPFETDDNGRISPNVSGAPSVINGFGDTLDLLNFRLCGYALLYEDVDVTNCTARDGAIRTWRLFDECLNRTISVEEQVIAVGDFVAPVVSCPEVDLDFNGLPDDMLEFSTSGFNCLANIDMPMPMVEECSEYTVQTRVFTWQTRDQFGFPLRDSIFTELRGLEYINGEVRDVPVGNHFFVYTVTDECNNQTVDTCAFRVLDIVPPVAFCNDDIIISLSSFNTAFVLPTDIDEGSRDNCDGTDIDLKLRRLVPLECGDSTEAYYTDWADFIEVTCCDAGKLVTVELRTIDQKGNANVCNSRIIVEDKIAPECIPPVNVKVECDALPAGFDPNDLAYLQNSFGIPGIIENCEAYWEELSPEIDLDNCGVGTVTRRFRVVDNFDNVGFGDCEQTITIEPIFDYGIKFPADVDLICGDPIIDTLELVEMACEMLAVNVQDDEIALSAGACFRLERIYQVINWCEYDGISDPVVVSRDADLDGERGDEAVWLRVTREGETYLDRNIDPTDSIPTLNERGIEDDTVSNPYGYWISSEETLSLRSVGFWQYTQYINVTDTVAPSLNTPSPDDYCSSDLSCEGIVEYAFSVDETCSGDDLDIDVIVDELNDRISDYALPAADIRGTYPNFELVGVFPIGTHRFLITAEDGCGNETKSEVIFTVVDCKAPGPICQDGLVAELSRLNEPIDVDGDMELDLAMALVPATAYAASPIDDCSGPVTYSINRRGLMPSPEQDSLILTCNDLGIVLVEVHVWDQAGNNAFCNTFIDVQNNSDACNDTPAGAIYGIVRTELDEPVKDVEVQLSGGQQQMVMSSNLGFYNFTELEEGQDFTVRPSMDGNYRGGVSTFDLILIRKHILGVKLLETPYKILAADANNSGNISVLDLIQLQKIILGIEAELDNTDSWRFIDANHTFINPINPWAAPIPNVININNLDQEYTDADFVAIKVGDVNNSINPSTFANIDARNRGESVLLRMDTLSLSSGDTYEVPIYLDELSQLEGFQLGLQLDMGKLKIVEVNSRILNEQAIALFKDQGQINMAAYQLPSIGDFDEPLLTLSIQAKATTSLRESISLSSRTLVGEAYHKDQTTRSFALEFTGNTTIAEAFDLFQNYPNPAMLETYIEFYLPKAVDGRLEILDQNGTLLQVIDQEFGAGKQVVRLETARFTAGVLYYRFQSDSYNATRKMIIVH